jgi:hypothetical protein
MKATYRLVELSLGKLSVKYAAYERLPFGGSEHECWRAPILGVSYRHRPADKRYLHAAVIPAMGTLLPRRA